MNFLCHVFTPNILQFNCPYVYGRPMLTAKLQWEDKPSRYFEFLIDTGADYTLIPDTDAALLGISYNELPEHEIRVEAANFTFIHAKKTIIKIKINETSLKIPVLVSKDPMDRLLGRKGVFNHFEVNFQECYQNVTFTKNIPQ